MLELEGLVLAYAEAVWSDERQLGAANLQQVFQPIMPPLLPSLGLDSAKSHVHAKSPVDSFDGHQRDLTHILNLEFIGAYVVRQHPLREGVLLLQKAKLPLAQRSEYLELRFLSHRSPSGKAERQVQQPAARIAL